MGRSALSTATLDFTSALYLGLHHPSSRLRPWSRFTTGYPAALAVPPGSEHLASELARLQGCERSVLGTSTFHMFWDLFGMLSRRAVTIWVDAGTYPIARWGVERAAARGARVRRFPHHDAEALRRSLGEDGQGSGRQVVVCDGFCPDCGKPAPLAEYLQIARGYGGVLILDDTQALGIFGHSRSRECPYGREGGGMLKRIPVSGPDVLVVTSLAKAFGVPLAAFSGSRAAVENFKAKSETRVHCSPPATPVIRAAEYALRVNRSLGERLRARLAGLILHFRRNAAMAGFRFAGGLFPVQTLSAGPQTDLCRLHERLLQRGIRTVLGHAPGNRDLRVLFLITARHTPEAIDRAVAALRAIRDRDPIYQDTGFPDRRLSPDQ